LTIWVVCRHRPYAIIEDAELLTILQMPYEPVKVPSVCTLSRDIQEVFEVSCQQVGQILQKHDGRLHLGVDGWAVPNIFSYLGVTVTLCVTGHLITMILDFIR
ncbi:hypothetical protein K439DRAFT_1354409, partial [Ramaria rubella]